MVEAPPSGDADPLRLQGVIPPTITAFESDGSLDEATTAAHARFVVDRGVHAVFPLGTNGEFALLSATEREQVITTVVDAVGSDVPVIAGVGAPGTRETIRHAKAAERAGADGLVVVSPYYYPLDDASVINHYRRIASETESPIYVYHIPSKTGNTLSLDAVTKIASIDCVAGLKDSSKDVPWLGQAFAANPELTFMAGSDSLLVPGLDIGCAGLVSAVANAFPEVVVELYETYDNGNRERARALQERVYEIRSSLKRGPYMAGVKQALSLRGFEAGPLRDPLREMSDQEATALERDLRELDLL